MSTFLHRLTHTKTNEYIRNLMITYLSFLFTYRQIDSILHFYAHVYVCISVFFGRIRMHVGINLHIYEYLLTFPFPVKKKDFSCCQKSRRLKSSYSTFYLTFKHKTLLLQKNKKQTTFHLLLLLTVKQDVPFVCVLSSDIHEKTRAKSYSSQKNKLTMELKMSIFTFLLDPSDFLLR